MMRKRVMVRMNRCGDLEGAVAGIIGIGSRQAQSKQMTRQPV